MNILKQGGQLRTREEFVSKLLDKFSQNSSQPKSCTESIAFSGLYKCVVTKQASFFYRIKAHEIEVITIVDNRQDPTTIEEEIKKQ